MRGIPSAQAVIKFVEEKNGSLFELADLRHEARRLEAELRDEISKRCADVSLRRVGGGAATPHELVETLARQEAVHESETASAFAERYLGPGRECYGLYSGDQPVVFVLAARAIGRVSDMRRVRAGLGLDSAGDTLTFYAINAPHRGLGGLDLGRRLLDAVVAEGTAETFVTLSPVPGLNEWLAERSGDMRALCVRYLQHARRRDGSLRCPVAHFHAGNGARLLDVVLDADDSPKRQRESRGVMVHYEYQPTHLNRRRLAYASLHALEISPSLEGLVASSL